MREVLTFACCFALLLGCSSESPSQKAGISSDNEIVEISIMSPTSWWLQIHRDGSGQVGFGALIHDVAGFPERTFRFKELYEALASTCVTDGSISTDFAVAFMPSEATSAQSKYCSDAELMRKLFAKGIVAANKSGTRVSELAETQPPVP